MFIRLARGKEQNALPKQSEGKVEAIRCRRRFNIHDHFLFLAPQLNQVPFKPVNFTIGMRPMIYDRNLALVICFVLTGGNF